MGNLYEDLGVGSDATKEEITKAYRKKAQKAHPDKGGDIVVFQGIVRAYGTLSDDDKRKRYDELGDDGTFVDRNAQITTALSDLFLATLAQVKNDDCDILALMKRSINFTIQATEANIDKMGSDQKLIERASKRISKKANKKQNVFTRVLANKVDELKRGQQAAKLALEGHRQVLAVLDEYGYDFTPPESAFASWSHTNTRNI